MPSSALDWKAYRKAFVEVIEGTLGTVGCRMTISQAPTKSASQMECGETPWPISAAALSHASSLVP